jgi:hypothetical protein
MLPRLSTVKKSTNCNSISIKSILILWLVSTARQQSCKHTTIGAMFTVDHGKTSCWVTQQFWQEYGAHCYNVTRRESLLDKWVVTRLYNNRRGFLCGLCRDYITRAVGKRTPVWRRVATPHHDPTSRMRQQKGKSQIGDSKIWSPVPRDSDPR